MDAVVALEQQRAALSDSVVQARRKLRRAKAAAKACARVWQPTATQRHTALITYAMTGYQAEPSVRYLEMLARGRHWPARDSAELHALVEEWFLAVGVDELAALSDVAAPSDVAAMREAAPIVEEWRLAWWGRGQNLERGVAPSTADLLDRVAAERLRSGHPDPYARGTTALSVSRKWASRFRRRWGARYGALPVVEDLPLAEMREKARACRRAALRSKSVCGWVHDGVTRSGWSVWVCMLRGEDLWWGCAWFRVWGAFSTTPTPSSWARLCVWVSGLVRGAVCGRARWWVAWAGVVL